MAAGRPHPYGEAVADILADVLTARVLDWLCLPAPDVEDRMRVYNALHEAVELESDGYALARTLEAQYGFESDTALVRAFEDLPLLRSAVTDRLVRAWVAASKLVAEFKVGDHVVLDDPTQVYTVLEVDPGLARYRVTRGTLPVAQLQEAVNIKSAGKRRALYVPFEDVHASGLLS